MKPCQRCGKCCRTHPCALSPKDLKIIGKHLGMTIEQLCKRYIVIDYVQILDERHYYLCPARQGDTSGTAVHDDWTFSNSPCVFLKSNDCTIEEAKPKGGRTLSCSLMTTGRNEVGYGKANAVIDWDKNRFLKRMISTIEPHVADAI